MDVILNFLATPLVIGTPLALLLLSTLQSSLHLSFWETSQIKVSGRKFTEPFQAK